MTDFRTLFYQEFVLLIAEGCVGINLQSTKDGRGAFIESFYRSKEGALYAAERSGNIQIGDRIAYVEDDMILFACLEDIYEKLSLSLRPIRIRFWRYSNRSCLTHLIKDSRANIWLKSYLKSYSSFIDAADIKNKINVLNATDILIEAAEQLDIQLGSIDVFKDLALKCIIFCLEQYPNESLPDQIIRTVASVLTDTVWETSTILSATKSVNIFIKQDLEFTLLFRFRSCVVAKRMVGWMSASPGFYPLTISDIIKARPDHYQKSILTACYYLFLSKLDR